MNYETLSEKERTTLLKVFDNIKAVEFPSLLNQLETNYWARSYLDKSILTVLGFKEEEVDEILPKLYHVLAEELRSTKEIESK